LKKLKAAEWEFKKFIPDQEDLYAKMKTLENVRNHLDSLNMNDGEEKVHLYTCGFYRGCSWMRDKMMVHIKQLVAELEQKKLELQQKDLEGLRNREIL
jgi:hypothetical protein